MEGIFYLNICIKEGLHNFPVQPTSQNTTQNETPRNFNAEVDHNLWQSLNRGLPAPQNVATPSLQNYEPSHWPSPSALGNQRSNQNAGKDVLSDTDATLATDAKNVQRGPLGPMTRSRAKAMINAETMNLIV